MEISLDRTVCQAHGQCAIVAPQVFTIRPDGLPEYVSAPGDGLRELVEYAADVCPTQAISLD